MKNTVIIFSVTFIFFFIEALIHYNIGKNDKKVCFPNTMDLFKIIGTIVLFTILSTITINYCQKIFK